MEHSKNLVFTAMRIREDQKEALRIIAFYQRTTQNALMRDALDAFLKRENNKKHIVEPETQANEKE